MAELGNIEAEKQNDELYIVSVIRNFQECGLRMNNNNEQLIKELKQLEAIRSPEIEAAFKNVEREYFVPEEEDPYAYINTALPIGEEQTISQPSVVAMMLELLEVEPGQRILDIGSGSGWTTALLSFLTGEKGSVIGLERIASLAELGRKNTKDYKNLEIRKAEEGVLGIPGEKFDRILVSAMAQEPPTELLEQLKSGGVLVVPVGIGTEGSLTKYKLNLDGDVDKIEVPGFSFVPLIP